MMAHKLASVSLLLVGFFLALPAFAQRGGGGGGGGHCGGGGTQSLSNFASASSPYSLNPMANPYALQQMQQQYAQQAMAVRQMYAMQMENQLLRNQMMQLQKNARLAQAKLPVNAQGDSNILLAAKKDSAATKKKASSKARTVAQRDKQKATEKADAEKIAMNDVN